MKTEVPCWRIIEKPQGYHHSDHSLQQHIFEKSSSVGTRTLSISSFFTCTASSTSTYHIQKYQTAQRSRPLAYLVCLTNATLLVLYSLEEIIQKDLTSFHTSPVKLNPTSQCLGGRCPLSRRPWMSGNCSTCSELAQFILRDIPAASHCCPQGAQHWQGLQALTTS